MGARLALCEDCRAVVILFLPLSLRFCRDLDLLALAMHEQPRSACRFSAPGSRGCAGCRDDSNRRGRLWPDKFYCLVVPHMVRRIAGGRHRWLMPFRP